VKSVVVDIESLSARVRQALEAVPGRASSAARRDCLEIAAILGRLRTADDVILRPKEPYTRRLLHDVPKIYEEWDLSTV
jgi:hypothetical protein